MNNTDGNYCTQCPEHCPVTDLKCGKGRSCFGQQRGTMGEKRDHKHDRRHEHNYDHRHGCGQTISWEQDDLYNILRTCGHYLYHRFGKDMGQGRILAILSERESITQKELQEILRIQSGSVTEILTKLEEKGLIRRKRDERDKRCCIIELTEEGCEVFDRRKRQEGERAKLFTALDEAEQEELKRLLGKLLEDWE